MEAFIEGRLPAARGSSGVLTVGDRSRAAEAGGEELIDALWGEDLPAAPRNALQHHVARLRRVLGQNQIVAAPHGYALNDAWVDALRFEELLAEARVRLRERDARSGAESVSLALGLWRGPPLRGLPDTSWSRAAAQRLEALRVDALEEQFEAALAAGEQREIVSALRTALEQSPFRGRLWGQLMLALYRSGRQADALEAFQQARRILARRATRRMAPPAMAEEQLKELGRRIDGLAARQTAETGTWIQRRIAELRRLKASARAAAHDAAASIEENVLGVEVRVKIAEQTAAVELAQDKDEVLDALVEELGSWDVRLERLQVKVATTAGDGRDQADVAIRQLRRHRNTLGASMAEVTSNSGEAWYEVREHVKAARNELESRAAEVEATLQKGATHNATHD